MVIIGFVLFAAAAVVAGALIVQNPGTVTVHAFTWSWDVDMRWLVVAGLGLAAIGLLGLAMMGAGSARHARLRRERRALAAENRRLADRASAENRQPADYDRRPAGYEQRASAAAPAAEDRTDGGPTPSSPATSSTGSVAAPERPPETSTERHGIRERLAASRHRRVEG